MAKKMLVIANWKMYIESPKAAKKMVQGIKRSSLALSGVEIWLAPSFVLLPGVSALLKRSLIKVGAQTLSAHSSSSDSAQDKAHTGEVSAVMLKNAGVSFVIVGHSERRAAGESDEAVRAELLSAAETVLSPVLCIGERERTPDGAHWGLLEAQLASALRDQERVAQKLVVAYEPVWAIGKSAKDAMAPSELEETIIFIRKTLADLLDRPRALKVRILYGGSVEGENASALVETGGAGGFLVGHASADISSFVEIIKTVRGSKKKQ